MELGQHAEFLGIMPSNEMLARWFISDQTQMGRYRLKSHGVNDFWDWVASWARAAESPLDLGYDGSRYVLPDLVTHRHRAFGDSRVVWAHLLPADVSATDIYAVKRDTTAARVEIVAQIIAKEPDEPWLIWCDTDFEADALKDALPDALEIRGSMTADRKESIIEQFLRGRASLITKPSVCGAGLNFQHCARVAYVGRTFSYESFYQSVRRCWRFGQTREVHVHLVVAEGEDQIGRVIDRKAEDHRKMKRAMAEAMRRAREKQSKIKIGYEPNHIGRLPAWLKSVV
jgi:hypothetical protein